MASNKTTFQNSDITNQEHSLDKIMQDVLMAAPEHAPKEPVSPVEEAVSSEITTASSQVPSIDDPTESVTPLTTTATGNSSYSTTNTPISPVTQPIESIELDSDVILRELTAMQDNGKQMDQDLPIQFEDEDMISGLKPESIDPFLFDTLTAPDEHTSPENQPLWLGMTSQEPNTSTIGNSFNSALCNSTPVPHPANGTSLFPTLAQPNWSVDDFIGTPVSLPPPENSEHYRVLAHGAQHSYVAQMLDDHGRRRSQSMPPEGSFTFRRKMGDGRFVGISKPPLQQNSIPSPAPGLYGSGIQSPHGFRHHPYDRSNDGRNGFPPPRVSTRGKPGPRSYPTTPREVSPRSLQAMSADNSGDRMSLDTYHGLGPTSYDNTIMSPDREVRRRGRGVNKKGPPPPTLLSPRHELEAMATPILVQLEAFRNSILQQFHELKYPQYDHFEA